MKVFHLKTCDTCRKALKWLDSQGIQYIAHEIGSQGLAQTDALELIAASDRANLVNRRSTTWRGLSEEERAQSDTDEGSAALLHHNPKVMKRPVFVSGMQVYVGFDEGTKLALSEA